MRQGDRTRADAGRFGTMYDEGACLATPALELIARANREAAEARLVAAGRGSDGENRWPAALRGLASRIDRWVGRGR